jgi:hypothetical protein
MEQSCYAVLCVWLWWLNGTVLLHSVMYLPETDFHFRQYLCTITIKTHYAIFVARCPTKTNSQGDHTRNWPAGPYVTISFCTMTMTIKESTVLVIHPTSVPHINPWRHRQWHYTKHDKLIPTSQQWLPKTLSLWNATSLLLADILLCYICHLHYCRM